MSTRWNPDLTAAQYDDRWRALEASGANPHGEADFVARYAPASVLDAGCGTGRVAIELARRGVDVVGTDLDGTMLDVARAKASALPWIEADLAALALGRTFDLVVMAGNVMLFVEPSDRGRAVARLAAHLDEGGLLVAGFQLGRGVSLDEYDAFAEGAGCTLVERCATWDGAPFVAPGDYAVSVHRLVSPAARATVHDLLAESSADAPPRLAPHDLAAADAPLVVDTRTGADIVRTGWIAGSVHAPRTVTEWRADPASGAHDPAFDSFERLVVVVCSEGYSSRLTAANLRRLGYPRATDLVGGIDAWRRAGLPLVAPHAGQLADDSPSRPC